MFTKSIITGSIITAVLISVLAVTRLIKMDSSEKEAILYNVEQVTMDPLPEPPMDEEENEEEEEEEDVLENPPVAPLPALDLLADVELDATPLPLTTAQFDPQLAISSFEIDRDPADLPVLKVVKPVVKQIVKATPRVKVKWVKKVRPVKPVRPPKQVRVIKKPKQVREKVKSSYPPSRLDSKPRMLRQGRFTWPRGVRGTKGSVALLLEIGVSGKVRVVRVISTTDAKLVNAARRVASNSRFTAPKYKGVAVKTQFKKTYHLKKPRR